MRLRFHNPGYKTGVLRFGTYYLSITVWELFLIYFLGLIFWNLRFGSYILTSTVGNLRFAI